MRVAVIILLCSSLAFGTQISTIQVAASADDLGGLRGAAWGLTTTTSAIGRSITGASYFYGARFLNVPIPVGATIDSVVVQVLGNASQTSTTVNWSLMCEDTADATTFTDSTNFHARNRTTSVYYWAALPSFSGGTWYNVGGSSANIKAPFVELFARSDWASGNDVVVFIKDSASSNNTIRTIRTYDLSGNVSGPKLDIWYTAGGVPGYYHGVAGVGRLHSPQGNSVLHKK